MSMTAVFVFSPHTQLTESSAGFLASTSPLPARDPPSQASALPPTTAHHIPPSICWCGLAGWKLPVRPKSSVRNIGHIARPLSQAQSHDCLNP